MLKLIKNQSDTLTFRLRTVNPDKQLMNNLYYRIDKIIRHTRKKNRRIRDDKILYMYAGS